MSYYDLKFPWYKADIKNVIPDGKISLRQLIRATIDPKPKLRRAFESIQKAAEEGNLKLKDSLKQKHLFFTTPSVDLEYRNYNSIKEFLPLAVFEYDKIPYAEELKEYIFDKFKSCIFAFSSPSKTGCKFIFHIEKPTSVEHYKELFYGIAFELDKFIGFDCANSRCVLPLFISWDENALYRDDAVLSTVRGFNTRSFNNQRPTEFKVRDIIDKEEQKEIVSKINSMFDAIDVDAHTRVVSYSFYFGGLVGANHIDEKLAFKTLTEAIERNDYMSKNTRGYIRTATEMFYKGIKLPINYDKKREIKNDVAAKKSQF